MVNWQEYFDRSAGVMDWDGFFAAGGKMDDIPQNIRDSFGLDGGAYDNDIDVQTSSGDGDGSGDGSGGSSDILGWIEGRVDPWMEYQQGASDYLDRVIESGGVGGPGEADLARSTEAAVERGLGAAGVQGSLYGGMVPALTTGAFIGANAKAHSLRDERVNQAIDDKYTGAGQLADLLGRSMGAGATTYAADKGFSPFQGIWSKGGNQTSPFQGFGWPLTEGPGGEGEGGGGKKPRGNTGDRSTTGVPEGCWKVFDRDGNWVSTDCSGQ